MGTNAPIGMPLSPNRRIALNVAATYGRSLVALACGLISGRWVLMTLGVVDYGILGLIGGLVAFVSFLNGVLSGVVARFYALSVGKGDLGECRRWFTVAVSVHTVVPLALMAVGYPLGEHAIAHWLTIPAERVGDAIWVWRFVCVGSFVSMANVPFNAMFVAKQRFMELSAYAVAGSVVNVCALYYMVTHPGAWLVRLSALSCSLTVLPALVVMIRAVVAFGECRIVRAHLWNMRDIRELGGFVGWMTIGGFGLLLRSSGMTVLVNKLFGPARNAALSVSVTVSDHASALTGSLLSAFLPAITSAYGAGDARRVSGLLNASCKFSVLALLPFVIPLALEIDEVMRLWLKTPPEGAQSLCVWIMVSVVVDRMTSGLWVVIEASGRVAVWQMVSCAIKVSALVLAGALAWTGMGLDAAGVALTLVAVADGVSHVMLYKRYFGFSSWAWIKKILLPLIVVAAVAVAVGALPRLLMPPSFLRVVVTTLAVNLTLLPLVWRLGLNASERELVKRKWYTVIHP